MEKVSDMNVLYEGFKSVMKSSAWKEEAQRFENDLLSNLVKLHNDLEDRTYKTQEGVEFILNERGKTRYIHGRKARDRVVRHALCDHVLRPILSPYIIHNNAASQIDKGVDFARNNFEHDLHNYWLEHRNNDGWIAFVDFKKYYDNIQHKKLLEKMCPMLDEFSAWLLSEIVGSFSIDVSYMTDEQYSHCIEEVFNSVEYNKNIPKSKRTKEKFMPKSVDVGDLTSQTIGVFYPTPIDIYVTVVRGFRKYGRYMDDMYLIHEDKDYLIETIKGIEKIAADLGLFINKKKTHIAKLSDRFTYLQMKYFMTDSGKVVKRISPKTVTRERRKLKKYKNLLSNKEITYDVVEQAYKSWMGRYAKCMSKEQVKNMKKLYMELFDGRNPRWKKETIQSH